MNSGKYYLRDYESGNAYEVSKDQYDRYHKAMLRMFSEIRPIVKPELKGRVLVMGTAGDLESSVDFEDIFRSNIKIVKRDGVPGNLSADGSGVR